MSLNEAFHLVRGIALLAFFAYAILQPDKPRRTAESLRNERIARRAICRREREARLRTKPPARKRRTYRLR